MTLTRSDALALMHEYTASDALRKHMYAVEIAMRAMAEREGEDPDAWGLVGLVHDFDYERYPQRRALAPPRSTRPKGCGSWPRADCRSRCSARSWATPTTPACRATRRWPRRSSRWTSCAASWWPAPWCGRRGASRISRSRQRQEEAQGQGVRPRGEPRGRHSGRRGAGRAARRAHRVRARRAPTTRAGPRARPGVTGPAADGVPQSVACATQPRGRRTADPGQPGRAADRRPRRLRGDAGSHRARLPLDPFRELHHPERHRGLALRGGAGGTGAGRAPGAGALRRAWARCSPPASSGGSCAAQASRSAPSTGFAR